MGATVALRVAGQYVLGAGDWNRTLVLFALRCPATGLSVRTLCRRFGLRREDWSFGAILLLLPTLLLEARLKSAALDLFAEQGYEKTSIDQISLRAKLAVGGFYQHFRSKRQLLLVLMDDLLEQLNQLNLRPDVGVDIRTGLHRMLAQAFSVDLRYLGVYRAWQEAVLSDPDLSHAHQTIHGWTTARVLKVFKALSQLPGARSGVDVVVLARVMDTFFWSLLAEALRLPKGERHKRVESATHLIYHAMFVDSTRKGRTT